MKTSILSLILIVSTFAVQNTFAQATQRVRPDFQHGDIVVSTTGRIEGELGISNQANAENVIGVYNASTTYKNTPEIYLSGIAYIRFDHSNGAVVRGDYITSSSLSGKGMKATESGMVVGVALESSTPTTELVKILVQPSWVKQTIQN